MAEVITLDQAAALAFATEFVAGKFKDARELPDGGWSVLCPRCDGETRLLITRDLTFNGCPNGHTQAQILRAIEPKEPSRWGFQTAAEFLGREFPPSRWLYMDLIPAESVSVVMAAPNAGKTFFALDVVAQVAVKAAEQGATVWIVEEEGTGAALQWRLSRALASVGVDQRHEAAERIHIAWNTGRSIRNKEDLAALAEECEGAELIMLDSLSALAGGFNENDSEEMAAVAEALHQLKTITGAAIMALHHMTKAAWPDGQTPRLEHMRGHGALPGRADAVLALVPLESDATEVRFELHCVKQRDGSKPHARRFAVAMTGAAAVVEISDKENPAPHVVPSELRQIVLSHLPIKDSKPVSKNFLCNVIDKRRADVYRAVDQLIASGEAIEVGYAKYTCSGRSGVVPGTPVKVVPKPLRAGNNWNTRSDLDLAEQPREQEREP